jgi:2,3-dihydroxybenzoate decarboxylase
MASRDGTRIIALEEHYVDSEVKKTMGPSGAAMFGGPIAERLDDLGALRLKEMDEAGIDVQVISHAPPATQWLDAAAAVPLAKAANDRLKKVVDGNPRRFAAFATLPTPDPEAAAAELDRCVTKLGFKGAMIHGLAANQVFFDDKRFWPIYARAAALDVPIYIHPAPPHPAVLAAYLKDYLKDFPTLAGPAWGFTIETATIALRMVLSGVSEKHPGLKFILGHLGEGLPFLLHRISESLSRVGALQGKSNAQTWFRDVFCEHFWITTSGNFCTPALVCSMLEMGADRILFSVDWPFVPNKPGVAWMEGLTISPDDKRKLLHSNAEKLLKL